MSSASTVTGSPFLQSVREALVLRHYSARTVETYIAWVRRFVLFHGRRHPRSLGANEVPRILVGPRQPGRRQCAHAEPGARGLTLPLCGSAPAAPGLSRASRSCEAPCPPAGRDDSIGGRCAARATRRGLEVDGLAAVRLRSATARMRQSSGQGRGFRWRATAGATRQRPEGSRNDSTDELDRASGGSAEKRAHMS